MSTFGPLTLDGVVFSPSNISAGVAKWDDRSGGVPTGFANTTLQVKTPNKDSSNYRVVSKYYRPTIADGSVVSAPAGTVLRNFIADVTITCAGTSTAAERAQGLDEFQAWLASTNFVAAVDNLEPVNG